MSGLNLLIISELYFFIIPHYFLAAGWCFGLEVVPNLDRF